MQWVAQLKGGTGGVWLRAVQDGGGPFNRGQCAIGESAHLLKVLVAQQCRRQSAAQLVSIRKAAVHTITGLRDKWRMA